jgi:hypothetical protein
MNTLPQVRNAPSSACRRRIRCRLGWPVAVGRLAWLACGLASGLLARADHAATLHEYELKAGVLYNIIKYVEWPGEPAGATPATFEIALLGQIPFAEALSVLDGKTVQGRKVVVKRITRLEEAAQCQVLFIGASEKGRLAEITTELKRRPVLTVSEVEGFAEQGGMVNLVAGPNHIVMEINREVARESRLAISSQLLKLAKLFPK